MSRNPRGLGCITIPCANDIISRGKPGRGLWSEGYTEQHFGDRLVKQCRQSGQNTPMLLNYRGAKWSHKWRTDLFSITRTPSCYCRIFCVVALRRKYFIFVVCERHGKLNEQGRGGLCVFDINVLLFCYYLLFCYSVLFNGLIVIL